MPLLNADGTLNAWGWARRTLMEYDRTLIPEERRDRLKEWDYYAVMSPDFYLELTVADITWAVLATVSFIDYQTGRNPVNIYFGFDSDLLDLPPDPYENALFETERHNVSFSFADKVRTLHFEYPALLGILPPFNGEIRIQDNPEEDSLVTAYPFDAEKTQFFYTDKIVALPASGSVDVDGNEYVFPLDDSFAVLDWGRGVWPEEFEWGWAIAGGRVNGKQVGFNIGFGEEENSRGTGNSVVYDGVLHKMGEIEWSYDTEDVMQPWYFQSEDGRFDMTLEPFYDASSKINLIVYFTDTTKVHGRVSGRAVLDDGTVVNFRDVLGFAEHCFQKW